MIFVKTKKKKEKQEKKWDFYAWRCAMEKHILLKYRKSGATSELKK